MRRVKIIDAYKEDKLMSWPILLNSFPSFSEDETKWRDFVNQKTKHSGKKFQMMPITNLYHS